MFDLGQGRENEPFSRERGRRWAAPGPTPRSRPTRSACSPERSPGSRITSTHLAFGAGPYHCLGHRRARSELRIGLKTLFEKFPGLRPVVPPERVRMRTTSAVYGVHALPVTRGGRER
ncbi:cytochrome P450 [Nocardiopsis alba]|uniref:cytochrome P450 n=1 Tax=Nocardiopsis alba TaxID=53437 RepID=UPI0012696ED7|nr:cytochrome P450 [Nocardiopsis alba]